jgi:hypothetical protein
LGIAGPPPVTGQFEAMTVMININRTSLSVAQTLMQRPHDLM